MRPIMELTSRYRLESLIAAGGMGEVWRADDVLLDRRVAVKLLRPEYVHDPVILARFRAEARYEGQLSHPGIAQVYDYAEAGLASPAYLVMELVDGPSLAALLTAGPLPDWCLRDPAGVALAELIMEMAAKDPGLRPG